MLVKDRMSAHPITIEPDTSVTEALSFMRQNRVRRLPVVDRHGNLLGIVSEKDLLYASPSPATSLSVYEIGYLLSKLKVKEIMTREVITVCPDCPIEEAARIMVDHKIGGLPVVEDGRLVGIITETDLFKVFLEMLGAREQGLRVSVSVRNEPGTLARLASAIASQGGDILSLGTFYGEDRSHGRITLKVRGITEEQVRIAVQQAEAELRDIRTS
jgi:acetoin utilization protein AcuB